MRNLVEQIRQHTPADFDFDWLGRFVRGIDCSALDYATTVPEYDAGSGNYARNILLMDPFEVVVLHWPPGVESAIHHHEGFWGYVLCLEGEVENVEYTFDAERKELREKGALRVRAGGVLPEPDGTIHKIVNPSAESPLITVHFYAPALEDLDGMVLFDAEKGWRGELNATATTASFHQDEAGFRSLEKGAFTYIPMSDAPGNSTHMLYPLIPKPDRGAIMSSISAYYAEQAELYDHLDDESEKRRLYTGSIDSIIAKDLRECGPKRMLHIGCGTGRRAVDIRQQSGLDYVLEGVDISSSMVQHAKERGVDARIGMWNECTVTPGAYDAIAFLYAFGHIPNRAERKRSLSKVFQALKPGGRFYFDVFNVENPHEWGPEAVRIFDELNLQEEGYECGDVFYKRHDGEAVAFLHYTTRERMEDLVASCGLRVVEVYRIGYVEQSGQALDLSESGGNLLLVVEKPSEETSAEQAG
ncbi:MAG: methyltransferase domain-containing protein [Flavobacteriales bacterium]|nr:methyltransferase domain-containing protein [Flavobacteriales bacterium]